MEATVSNTLVIIPSYNEARAIGEVVSSIVDMGMSVLVIDDGSTDNTEKIALDAGAMVIRQKENQGKGFSVRRGFEYAMEKISCEWMVMMDGDGQHHPEDIPVLLASTCEGETDVVNGNRMASSQEMPKVRYYTNKFMSWVLSKVCGQDIPDSQCGFRLIKVDSLRKLELTSDKYDIESEMLIEASEKKMIIRSAPIQTIYGEEVSAINPITDALRFISLVFRAHSRNMRSKKAKS